MDLTVRRLRPSDRGGWEPLWAGYLRFYETDLDPEVTDLTWARFTDPDEPMVALGAFAEEGMVGICHHLLHRSTWARQWYAYLEDLYTAPEARGRGVGRALIEATADAARAAGAERLYWHTHSGNATARRLYDEVARHEGFVVYERDL